MAYYASGQGYAPTTSYNTVRKAWDKLLHEQTQSQLFFRGMIGRDKGDEGSLKNQMSNYPIVEKTDLRKEAGDRITMSLIRQLTSSSFWNAGKTGNNTLIDLEDTLSFYNTQVYVGHWRQGFAVFGKQTLQRTPFDVINEGKDLLSKAIQKQLDEGVFFAFYSGYSPNVVREIGTSTLLEKLPLNNIYGKNQSSLANLTSADTVDTDLLEIIGVVAVENNINPCTYEGKDELLFVIHPRGTKTLRQDSLYQDAQINAVGGKGNPMFNRVAIGKWNNIYIAEHNSIDTIKDYGTLSVSSDAITIGTQTAGITVTDGRMNILIGANAIARAVALPEYMVRRKEDDYENLFGFAGGLIYGDRRADYQIDDGTGATYKNQSSIVVYSYSPAVASNFTQIWS